MYYQRITVNPSEAAAFLTSSERNRPLKTKRIAAIADDITANRWSESPQPIVFNKDGKLIDGQHRMAAIVKADKPVSLWACYGVEDDVVIDRGVPRSTGDALFMRGVIEKRMASAEIVAIVRRYNLFSTGCQMMTDDAVASFIIENKDNLKKTVEMTHLRGCSVCKKTSIQVSIFAALKAGESEDKLRSFAYVVNTGFMNGPEQSAAIVLRTYAQENPSTRRVDNVRLAAVAQTAIKDFVNGNPRTKKYIKCSQVYIRPDIQIR